MSIDEATKELLSIVRNAEVALENANNLMNTDLCLDRFEELFNVVVRSIDDLQDRRDEGIVKERALQKQLDELEEKETRIQTSLKQVPAYKPQYKKAKVTLFSL